MNERKGEVFSIAAENAPVDGCTATKARNTSSRRERTSRSPRTAHIGSAPKIVQDGFVADIGLTVERRIKAGFTFVPESIRPIWKATDADLAAIPTLVTSLIA